MRNTLIGIFLLSSVSVFATETCVYVFQENNAKPLQAFVSCSGEEEGKKMQIKNNDGPLSKATHLAEIQEKKGMKLVNCTLAVRGSVAVNECLLIKN